MLVPEGSFALDGCLVRVASVLLLACVFLAAIVVFLYGRGGGGGTRSVIPDKDITDQAQH